MSVDHRAALNVDGGACVALEAIVRPTASTDGTYLTTLFVVDVDHSASLDSIADSHDSSPRLCVLE